MKTDRQTNKVRKCHVPYGSEMFDFPNYVCITRRGEFLKSARDNIAFIKKLAF